MIKLIKRIKNFYHSGDNEFYFSLAGPLAMGTIHLVYTLIQFDWWVFNYCLFSYLMAFIKVWQWSIEKFNLKPNNYIAGSLSILVLLVPMMVCIIMTIVRNNAKEYIFEWLVYAYALYGTIKMVLAIKKLFKKDKTDRVYVVSLLGLIAALYTMQMMEHRLILLGGNGVVTEKMYNMELITQGFIFIFSLFVIILFIYKLIKKTKKNKIEENNGEM